MKTIGLIGGTGWVSTVEYYRQINEKINQRMGGLNFARCILYSFNYGEIDALNRQNDREKLYSMILDASGKLVHCGVDCLVLCANTLHLFADRLRGEIDIPLVHIAEATAKQINNMKVGKVGLLGTRQTMEEDFYKSSLRKHGIGVEIPDREERIFIQNAITSELLKNIVKAETRQRFIQIMDHLLETGAQAIVLGCTEIPLLLKQEDYHLPLLNTLEIHTDAIVDYVLNQ